jgi:small neutral amino acid transporter SnatA (MarC family)
MDHSFLSALILLLLVLDPLGSLPVFIPIMRAVPKERRTRVAMREVGIAFCVLLAFMFVGEGFLRVMHLSERSLEVAGGVILMIIAIRMIFGGSGESAYGLEPGREPLIFPLAVPLLASRQPDRLDEWIGALSAAMLVSGVVLVMADRIRKLLGDSVVTALEKLMGLVLTAIAVEMVLAGLKRYFVGGL